jgi:hypothetical protein
MLTGFVGVLIVENQRKETNSRIVASLCAYTTKLESKDDAKIRMGAIRLKVAALREAPDHAREVRGARMYSFNLTRSNAMNQIY